MKSSLVPIEDISSRNFEYPAKSQIEQYASYPNMHTKTGAEYSNLTVFHKNETDFYSCLIVFVFPLISFPSFLLCTPLNQCFVNYLSLISFVFSTIYTLPKTLLH